MRHGRVAAAAAALAALAVPAAASANVKTSWRLSTDGLGPLKIGMTISQVQDQIDANFSPMQLGGQDGPAPGRCISGYVGPASMKVPVLGTGYRIAVVTVANRRNATKSGIRVGDSVAKLRRAYGSRLTAVRNFYVQTETDWEYARGNRKIRFYTPNGKVVSMDAGRKPEIDYVEGCA